MSDPYDDDAVEERQYERRRRRRRRRSGGRPLLAPIWFCLLGLGWFLFIAALLIIKLRRYPLTIGDEVVGAFGVIFGLFYFWVAYSVYHRKRYILEVAFACAGLGLFQCPFGTFCAICLLGELMAMKHSFYK